MTLRKLSHFWMDTIYKSKDGKEEKVFDALEWLAAIYRHIGV